jgi:hypothetical protein
VPQLTNTAKVRVPAHGRHAHFAAITTTPLSHSPPPRTPPRTESVRQLMALAGNETIFKEGDDQLIHKLKDICERARITCTPVRIEIVELDGGEISVSCVN